MEEKITAWIARDENGELNCFPHGKPIKVAEYDLEFPLIGYWDYEDEWLSMELSSAISLNKESFPQVKWKDKEPTKVDLIIKICE